MASPDILAQLGPFKWTVGGVTSHFPINSMEMTFSQDQAQHKFWGVDAAIVERNGRNPIVVNAKIPFTNHLVPGPNENFSTLYPTEFRAFVLTMANGTTGTLLHPEFGPINAKAHGDIRIVWDPKEARDGAMVTASWIETLDPENAGSAFINPSPIQDVQTFAGDLDSNMGKYPLPPGPVYTPDFATQMNKIAAISDQINLQKQRGAGQIDQISYRLNKIQDSITAVPVPPRTSVASIINPNPTRTNAALSTLGWPLRQSVIGMQVGLQNLRQTLLESGRSIVFYRVPAASTLAMVTLATQANVMDLLNLNPSLAAAPYVQTGTIVRYYGASSK